MPKYIIQYLYILRGEYNRLIFLVFGFLLLSVMELIGLGLIGPFVAAIVDPGSLKSSKNLQDVFLFFEVSSLETKIAILGFIVIIVYFIKNVSAYFIQAKVCSYSYGYRKRLIDRLMSVYIASPYEFYLERNSSSIITTVINHTKMITDDMLLPSLRLTSDSIVLAALSVFLLIYSPIPMTILLFVLLLTLVCYMLFVKPKIRAYGKDISFYVGELIGAVRQSIGAIKEIRVLGVEKNFLCSVSRAAEGSAKSQAGFYSLMLIPRYLIESVFVVFLVIYSFVIYFLSFSQESLISSLAIIAIAGMRMLPSITGISASIATMHYSKHALGELYFDIKEIEDERFVLSGANDLTTEDSGFEEFKSIEISNISFSYPNSVKTAIKKLSIEINEGDSIGLIGKSGSGKTTLIDILLGLYDVSEGEILFNGRPFNERARKAWLSQVAYIPQNPFIVDGTFEENIAFGVDASKIDSVKLIAAIEQAQLNEVLSRLPDGISTNLGEDGVKLSGGECQRVAIARAFYHNRKVFIFDEATSALDTKTESAVVKVIEALYGKKTVIVIAHRTSAVAHCDLIYRLEGGTVVACGTPSEMLV